ncbi:Broad-complex core protein isoform 6 [Camponotus floridanus]|uniref:Broad-complex core protein isoform 6 n=1 Tax=Camponotus floridanus TaxID=104421 RepID=E2AUH9_CAMFO|nr:broad-complex core protein isoforms 1/2/3/4/5 isoform X2 [Camponotus floridanus]EFN62905.1 Broad-complex core protein isoform 6 [Camponotus floridanus]
MGSSQQFSLRWNNYLKHITCAFDTLRTDEDLVDVTLSCEGKRIRAHKMLLSACSTYFRDLFKENPCQHPVIIFRNVKFDDLAALVDFMYQGEVNVVQEQLASFLTTAELLAVQGLTDGTGKDNDSLVEDDIEIPNEPEVQLQNISGKSTGDSKRNKSPSSPMPYHAIELQPEVPPNKRRKTRDSTNANMEKNSGNAKDSEGKTLENQTGPGSDPVEIIPLMPNLKLEMPEYLEQDGSSCSYEDQSIGDNALSKITIDDTSSNTPDHEQKPDISQTFYSSQSTSDGLDGKHQTDVGHLLSKPSTSGERVTQEAVQERAAGDAAAGGDDDDADAISASGVAELVPDDDYGQSGAAADAGLLFRCRICWKGFKHPMSLTLHKDLHTGQTRCPICQRIFSRSYDMKAHLLRIHKRQHTFSVFDAKSNFRK